MRGRDEGVLRQRPARPTPNEKGCGTGGPTGTARSEEASGLTVGPTLVRGRPSLDVEGQSCEEQHREGDELGCEHGESSEVQLRCGAKGEYREGRWYRRAERPTSYRRRGAGNHRSGTADRSR